MLVDQLAGGTEKRQAQPSTGRSYFGRFKRPAAACVLDWRKPALELERQVRALNVGRYPNPVGSPKLLAGTAALIVEAATASDRGGKPGDVLAVDDTSITVAAGEGSLVITSFSALDGAPVAIAAARASLREGQSVVLANDAFDQLTALADRSARDEAYWAKRFHEVETVDLPYRRNAPLASGATRAVEIPVPAEFRQLAAATPFAIAGAFLQFIGRVLGKARFDVAIAGQPLAAAAGDFTSLFATHGFLNVEIDVALPAWEQARRFGELR